jgi:hypothetical protein
LPIVDRPSTDQKQYNVTKISRPITTVACQNHRNGEDSNSECDARGRHNRLNTATSPLANSRLCQRVIKA